MVAVFERRTVMRNAIIFTIIAALLLAALACSRRQTTLQKEAAERTLNAWLTAQSAPFYKMIGQDPPVLTDEFRILDAPPLFAESTKPTGPPDPKERTLYFDLTGGGLIVLKTKQSDQFLTTEGGGGGKARFVWDQGAWYLVNVQFRDGMEVADIHFKVEGR
jgi:hypothetical protein